MKGILIGVLVGLLLVSGCLGKFCVPLNSNDSEAKKDCNCYYNETAFYPQELFTECQIKDGAVILHVFGMLYMFTALALICDEFFVPALEVIIDVLQISDDVAGATFMAAGGSAPEFFTSVIGVFISQSQVGVGTIIGSAVFNVLFVIGMCAVFSKELLTLTWWPLFRDVTFYSIGLAILIGSFVDQKIKVYEAAILFLWYICYCLFMKINEPAEKFVRRQLGRLPCIGQPEEKPKDGNIDHSLKTIFNTDKTNGGKPSCNCQAAQKASSESVDRNGDTEALRENGKDDAAVLIPCNNPECLNSKVTQFPTLALCANTLDPVGNADDSRQDQPRDMTDDQATFNDRVGELQRLQKIKPTPRSNRSFSRASLATLREHRFSRSALFINLPPVNHTSGMGGNNLNTLVEEKTEQETETENRTISNNNYVPIVEEAEEKVEEDQESDDEEKEEPLDLSWPDTCRARLFYIILAPILFPLAFSTPDVRRAKWRMFFPVTFVMSILWIAVFSYLMVWWTETLGRTIGLGTKPEIIGLTLIAAGTSVPDLITSVIVARKGLGDMAVSSSLGSNLFDICVGLPIPWLISLATGEEIKVDAQGMFCSVLMLFAMLIAIIVIIAICKWKMTKTLGLSMFMSYFVYLAIALCMGLELISCIFDKK
ncbi:hypothetical protein ACHWQZ_G010734 [Mnemiopsis leidyi]